VPGIEGTGHAQHTSATGALAGTLVGAEVRDGLYKQALQHPAVGHAGSMKSEEN